MEDFDFDLAEVSLDNNLPSIDDNYSDFTFNLEGGGSNDSSYLELKTLDLDNIAMKLNYQVKNY